MAGTTKILKDINNTREDISHLVDLLAKKQPTKIDITEIIKEKPLELAIFAVLSGVFAAFVSSKIKSILKFVLFIYLTKQSISYLVKK